MEAQTRIIEEAKRRTKADLVLTMFSLSKSPVSTEDVRCAMERARFGEGYKQSARMALQDAYIVAASRNREILSPAYIH